MAGIRQPIQDILTRLQTLQVVNGDGKTVNMYARVWNNQIKRLADQTGYTFPMPAAFLEVINSPQFAELGLGFQSADIGWRVHIAHEFYDAQDGTMDQDLTIFDLRDKVVGLLSLSKPTGCGTMARVAETYDYDHGNVYELIIDFICNFTDSKGSPWDPYPGKFIDSIPPTGLQVTGVIEDSLPSEEGTAPENNKTTFQAAPQYVIPH